MHLKKGIIISMVSYYTTNVIVDGTSWDIEEILNYMSS